MEVALRRATMGLDSHLTRVLGKFPFFFFFLVFLTPYSVEQRKTRGGVGAKLKADIGQRGSTLRSLTRRRSHAMLSTSVRRRAVVRHSMATTGVYRRYTITIRSLSGHSPVTIRSLSGTYMHRRVLGMVPPINLVYRAVQYGA